MKESIQSAKEAFLQAKHRLERVLATTADDRLNWSPSPSARTPLQIAAHASMIVDVMVGNLEGRTFAIPTPEEADAHFRLQEQAFSSREQVLKVLEENTSRYLAWLDRLTPELMESSINLPFGMGSVPMKVGISVMPRHIDYHVAQIDYVQTVYGDRDWHIN